LTAPPESLCFHEDLWGRTTYGQEHFFSSGPLLERGAGKPSNPITVWNSFTSGLAVGHFFFGFSLLGGLGPFFIYEYGPPARSNPSSTHPSRLLLLSRRLGLSFSMSSVLPRGPPVEGNIRGVHFDVGFFLLAVGFGFGSVPTLTPPPPHFREQRLLSSSLRLRFSISHHSAPLALFSLILHTSTPLGPPCCPPTWLFHPQTSGFGELP